MQDRFVLSIDLGSGGPKVALVDVRGRIAGWEQRSTRLIFTPDGGVEQEPDEWWNAVRDAAQSLLSRGLAPVDRIAAVVATTQWSVTTPVDDGGQALSNAVHWMDARGGPHSRRLMDGAIKIAGYGAWKLFTWLRLTGGAPTPSGMDVLSHLLFLKHERPEIYSRAAKFLEPADYLGLRLSGRAATSYASAFPYLLTDNRDCSNVRYSDKLLRLAGVDRGKLPDLAPVDAVLGPILPEAADELGLARTTQVVIGSGDSHAAVLGAGAVGVGELHLCIGTSSWITGLAPRRKVDLRRSITTMPSIVPGRPMIVAEQGPAGKLLEMFVETWFSDGLRGAGEGATAERYRDLLGRAASAPPGCDGVRFLPWLNGAGPPANDASMRGGILNLSLTSDPGRIVRAVLEGVACNLRWLLGPVERLAGGRVEGLNFIGGGARSDLWCQILADALDRRIRKVADPHLAIARGAAFSAFLALRAMRLDEIPGAAPIEREFAPTPERREIYDEMHREFLREFQAARRRRTQPPPTPSVDVPV